MSEFKSAAEYGGMNLMICEWDVDALRHKNEAELL